VLGLQVCATTPGYPRVFYIVNISSNGRKHA
jgi:hypothetical protein